MQRLFVFFDPIVGYHNFIDETIQTVKQIDVRKYPVTTAKYNVIVTPTVIIVDSNGNDVERYENVDIKTMETIYDDFIQRISFPK